MTFDCFNLQGGKILEKIRDLPQTHLLFENALQLPWQVANPNSKKKKKKVRECRNPECYFQCVSKQEWERRRGGAGGHQKMEKKGRFCILFHRVGSPLS